MNKIDDQFSISDGNLKVLETIPKMMKYKKYRHELRAMVLTFILNGEKQ